MACFLIGGYDYRIFYNLLDLTARCGNFENSYLKSQRCFIKRMFVSVLVTVPDLKTAETIASNLIEKRLAACANYFSTRSIYRWKAKIELSEEMII
jgi:hypothetical protein